MLNLGIDWDDVISPFNEITIELANRDHAGLDLTINDIRSWGRQSGKAAVLADYFTDERLYERQYVPEEARLFVNELRKKGNVYIITAVPPKFMAKRYEQIMTAFPDFPETNIIMGYNKSLIKLDIMLDDGPDNILKSSAAFPVLFRRPWNQALSGMLSVNTYSEFLQMIEQIKISMVEDRQIPAVPSVIALVGPSGCGKNTLADELVKHPGFQRISSYTTADADDYHIKLDDITFEQERSKFITTTMYAGKKYGLYPHDIEQILETGISPVIPLDIGGAISMKRLFPTLIVFCRTDRESMIENILEKDISNESKKYRLLSMENELKNAVLCDLNVRTDCIQKAVDEILDLFR